MSTLVGRVGKSIPFGEVAFFRVFISLIFLLPYLLNKKIPIVGRRWGLIMLRGVFGFIGLTLGFYAISKISLAEVSVLWKSSIIFTALLSVIILKEKITLRLACCIIIASIGAILILKPSTEIVNLGGLAALAAGLSVGFVSVSIRKLHQTEHSETIVFGFCFWGSILGLIFFGNSFVLPTLHQSFILLAIGVSGLLGQLLFTRAFLFAPASVVQPFTFIEVLFAAIFGAIFLGQIPDLLSVIGGLAIIGAGIAIVHQGTGRTLKWGALEGNK